MPSSGSARSRRAKILCARLRRANFLFSEVMKNMARGILLLFVAFTASALYGGQPSTGVAGVEVMVRQNPSKHVVTDARGTFAFDALPAGSYTLAFRAQKAKDSKKAPTSKVTVAESYTIKIDGTKRPVNQSGLTSNKLLAGLDIAVEIGSGGKIPRQVLAGGTKKMVWIPPALGSHIPGHWADADSKEASAFNRVNMSQEDVRNYLRVPDPHQEGFPGSGVGLSPPGR